MFVGYPAETEPNYKGHLTRKLSYGGRCNHCGTLIKSGTEAVWIKAKGVWHIACYEEC